MHKRWIVNNRRASSSFHTELSNFQRCEYRGMILSYGKSERRAPPWPKLAKANSTGRCLTVGKFHQSFEIGFLPRRRESTTTTTFRFLIRLLFAAASRESRFTVPPLFMRQFRPKVCTIWECPCWNYTPESFFTNYYLNEARLRYFKRACVFTNH